MHGEHAGYDGTGKGWRGNESQDKEEAKQAKYRISSIFVGLISIFFWNFTYQKVRSFTMSMLHTMQEEKVAEEKKIKIKRKQNKQNF